MCGIAGYICFDKARPTREEIITLHVSVQHRGLEAAGIGFLDPSGSFAIAKGPLKAETLHKTKQLKSFLDEIPPHLIMHTRMPTKGDPDNNLNNHPVEFGDWLVVHNGHIRNDDGIFKQYRTDRYAEVDSAAIPVILEKEADPITALSRLTGSWAVAALRRDPFTLFLGRENNPLSCAMDVRRGILFWASEDRSLAETFPLRGSSFLLHGFKFLRSGPWHVWSCPKDTAYEINAKGLLKKHEVKWDFSGAPSSTVNYDTRGARGVGQTNYAQGPGSFSRRTGERRATGTTIAYVPQTGRIINSRGKVVAIQCPTTYCEAIVSALWLVKNDCECPQCGTTLKGWTQEE